MAHPVQQEFCKNVKKKYPEHFKNIRALDVGSLDINGNNKELFKGCEYIGLDIIEGKNVDVVSIAHEYQAPPESFDTIVSTNAFEHDMYFCKSLHKMVELLKPGGLMFFSCASSWKEHGTLKTSPSQSATSGYSKEWENYYKNLVPEDVTDCLDLDDIFQTYSLKVVHKDLQFIGVKK